MTEETYQQLPQDEPMMAEPEFSLAQDASFAAAEDRSAIQEIETYAAEMAKMEHAGTPAEPYPASSTEANPFLAEEKAASSMSASNASTSASIEAANYQAEQSAVNAEMTTNANTEAAYQQSNDEFDQYISE